ncbi:DNA translocase FtsK 4TM domain-containing protein [bacterium]|nr:DNA translocase FtsK 4TM domain-containing protein [bacterium]
MSPALGSAEFEPQKPNKRERKLPKKKKARKKPMNSQEAPPEAPSWWDDSWHWAGLGLVGIVSPFSLVSLTMPSWTGGAGAWLAQGLYDGFGISALLLPAATTCLGLHLLLPRSKRPLQLSWAPTLMWLDLVWLSQRMGQQGGWFGSAFDGLVVAAIGPMGSWMGATLGLVASSLAVCRVPFSKVARSTAQGLVHGLELFVRWAHSVHLPLPKLPAFRLPQRPQLLESEDSIEYAESQELPAAPEVRAPQFLSLEAPARPAMLRPAPTPAPEDESLYARELPSEDGLVPLVPFNSERVTFKKEKPPARVVEPVEEVRPAPEPVAAPAPVLPVSEPWLEEEPSLESEPSLEPVLEAEPELDEPDEPDDQVDFESSEEEPLMLAPPEQKPDAEEIQEFVSAEKEKEVPAAAKNVREVYVEADGQMRLFPTMEKVPEKISYRLPPLSLLDELPLSYQRPQVEDKSVALLDSLASFGVQASLLAIVQGPTVTRYELQPARGVKVSRFTSLTNDIALALAAKAVRIEAPIPGKSAIGIEIPNEQTELVVLRDILGAPKFRKSTGMSIALGKDLSGTPTFAPLQKMPHLLVAGTTGSGKSVCINGLIMSLLYRFTPRELQLLMIDPKQVELSIYEGIPHLISLAKGAGDTKNEGAIICDPKRAALALNQIVELMEFRYGLFASARVRNLDEYNEQAEDRLPWVVVLIDELADLMMVASKSVETSICRIAQKARAAGIHLVLATQRPSADVITGLIKVNVPSRIAFAVSSQVDSRVILDTGGAEQLLGKGDMLFCPVDASDPRRLQGCYVTNEEILRVVEWWRAQGTPDNLIQLKVGEAPEEAAEEEEGDADDQLVEQALSVVLRRQQASASLLQTELKVGYARARRLIYLMEKKGYIGPAEGSKPRKILATGPA